MDGGVGGPTGAQQGPRMEEEEEEVGSAPVLLTTLWAISSTSL